MKFDWVLINRLEELTGYTEEAIRSKIKKGVWRKGVIWRHAPDNRLVFSLEAVQKWMLSA